MIKTESALEAQIEYPNIFEYQNKIKLYNGGLLSTLENLISSKNVLLELKREK